jgi:hypothetical protein
MNGDHFHNPRRRSRIGQALDLLPWALVAAAGLAMMVGGIVGQLWH